MCFLYGKTKYIFEDYTLTAVPNRFIYLAKGSQYEMHILEKSQFICVDFDFCRLAQPQKSEALKCNSLDIKRQFQKMLHIWNNKRPGYIAQIFSCVYNIYAEGIKTENKLYSKNSLLVSEITEYILNHYTEPDFSVNDISTHFGISEVHLRRLIDRAFCTSPVKYINNLKLNKAKNMLKISNYTIAEIAQSSGFADPYYFSRFFKQQTGVSPSEYRASVASVRVTSPK